MKVCAFTPRVYLGNPMKNAITICECIERAKEAGADCAVFPLDALTGATLGDLRANESIKRAEERAYEIVCEVTEQWDEGCVLLSRDDSVYLIKNGMTEDVFTGTRVNVLGVDFFMTANPAVALGYDKILRHVAKLSQVRPIVYVSAGYGESTTDNVPDGMMVGAENGRIIAVNKGVFGESFGHLTRYAMCEIDFLDDGIDIGEHEEIEEDFYNPTPFLPLDKSKYEKFARDIFHIQVAGLARRLEHIRAKCAVVNVSGGLDSALALLVAKKACSILNMGKDGLVAITLPCFGTTGRTLGNARGLMEATGAVCREISIKDSVLQHFKDIGHDESDHSVTYENAQARERTQIGLDLANKLGGLFVGTGDLSELMLGFTTYSGDHMSMYGVNSGLPKTIVRFVTQYLAKTDDFSQEARYLRDILDTPISPELLPPNDDVMVQKTESILGSYDVHDYAIYHLLDGVASSDIFEGAKVAFEGKYSENDIKTTLETLMRRFVTQQFKRSCAPDGAGVLGISVSPRGGLNMPSDMEFDALLQFEF